MFFETVQLDYNGVFLNARSIFNYGIKNRFLIFLIMHKAAYPSGNQ